MCTLYHHISGSPGADSRNLSLLPCLLRNNAASLLSPRLYPSSSGFASILLSFPLVHMAGWEKEETALQSPQHWGRLDDPVSHPWDVSRSSSSPLWSSALKLHPSAVSISPRPGGLRTAAGRWHGMPFLAGPPANPIIVALVPTAKVRHLTWIIPVHHPGKNKQATKAPVKFLVVFLNTREDTLLLLLSALSYILICNSGAHNVF